MNILHEKFFIIASMFDERRINTDLREEFEK